MFWVLGIEYEWDESYAELLMEKKNCGKCEVIFEDVLYSIYRVIKSIHLVQSDHCGVKLDCKLKTLLQVFGPWAVVQIAVSCLYGHVVWRQNICVCAHVL